MFVAQAGRGAESCPGREQFVEDRENDGHEKDPDGPMCQGVNDRAASLSHLVRDHSGEFVGSVRAIAFARGAELGIAGPILIGDGPVRLRPDEPETELLPRGREVALVTLRCHLTETRGTPGAHRVGRKARPLSPTGLRIAIPLRPSRRHTARAAASNCIPYPYSDTCPFRSACQFIANASH